MDGQNGEQQPEVKNEQQQEQAEPVYMFSCYVDPISGQQQWYMLPDYVQFFQGMLGMIEMMEGTTGKKWTQEEVDKYFLFLNDLKSYIVTYVYPGVVNDFNAFMDAMNKYGEEINPIGYELYNHQVEYLEAKAQGRHYKIEKKTKKDPAEQPKKERPVVRQAKQQQIVRKQDPTITAEELINKEIDPAKFTFDIPNFKKESGNLIFIGHVDSGKSTLTGNIMKQLKQIDQQELQRNKQEAKENHMEAWQLAFIADIDPSERKRGKTVECSKMMLNLQNRRYTLFDAPGHKGYVPNMMMGACQADIAVLIISAKDGEFEAGFEKEGQTKEHAMLATALGVQKMIAVVSKMGTVDWSQERFNNIKTQVTPFLQNSCGFTGVQFIPIDSINNINIHRRQTGSWYDGPSLIEVLCTVPIPKRQPDGPLRMPIVDKFKDLGNFYLYGKIESGKIAYENQVVSLLPRRVHFTIKEIFNARDEKLPYALAGENVKLRIKGIDEDQVNRGDIICSNSNFCQQSMEFKANLTVLELPEHKKLVSSGYQCVIHMHAISEQAEISLVQAKIEKQTKKVMKATFIRPGQTGKVVIKLRSSVCMQKFDFMPSLGRFTLRDEGKTIGFGEVTKIKPAKALLKEQKEQLGIKTQAQNITEGMKKVQISQ